ncbi:MAG: hypothetical protein DI584_00880 [Stenotrophomonas sp.]|nr:MAG: hypothetical protein DI584_00880 [Stenotrophomonas sp.]
MDCQGQCRQQAYRILVLPGSKLLLPQRSAGVGAGFGRRWIWLNCALLAGVSQRLSRIRANPNAEAETRTRATPVFARVVHWQRRSRYAAPRQLERSYIQSQSRS